MIVQKIPSKVAVQPATSASEKASQVDTLAQDRLRNNADATLWPTEYDGCNYANIIEAWLQGKGIYGGVAQGNRNNMYYQLALELRYICDFKADWLMQIMPTWEMPLAERESTIHSALSKPRGRNVPEPMLSAIEKVKSLGDISELDEQAVSNEMRNPLPKQLPYAFRQLARRFPSNPHSMIVCSLPILGALCTNVRAEYIDGEVESPLFYAILTSPQATGKKVVRKLDEMLGYPIKEHDDEERAKVLQYKRDLKAKKNEKKQPEEPEVHIRRVPAKISQRVFLERTYFAEGKSLYSFGEELDTLTKAMKGGAWADLSDILRLAFDGGEIGSDYASENSFAAVCQARWCMLLAGTWGAVERFFPNLEDGTMTRFMFAQLEDNTGKPLLPKSKRGMSASEEALRAEARRLYEAHSHGEPTLVKMNATINALLKWQDLQIQIFNLGGKTDTALDTLRRRSMLMGFRAALVAAATEKMRDSELVANFAVWVAQEVLDQQMALFGKELNAVNRREQNLKREVQSNLRQNSTLKVLAMLPETFTIKDCEAVRAEFGLTGPPHTQLHRWEKQGLIKSEKVQGEVKYQKTKK